VPTALQKTRCCNYWTSPAVDINAAFEKQGPSARPAGSSTMRLHCLLACAKGMNVSSWPESAAATLRSNVRKLGEAAVRGREVARRPLTLNGSAELNRHPPVNVQICANAGAY
jgi:hypothetical protein